MPETGATFEANALLKARAIAAYTGLPAVADDSGLCVDALNGMPGVLSARWAGQHGDDKANLELVLAQVADVPDARLGARFVCAAALVVPADGDAGEWVVTGEVEGRLIRVPRGSGGFGYDPIFQPDGFDLTTAEMTPEAKDAISHRGRAFRALAPYIQGRPHMTEKRLAPGDPAPGLHPARRGRPAGVAVLVPRPAGDRVLLSGRDDARLHQGSLRLPRQPG